MSSRNIFFILFVLASLVGLLTYSMMGKGSELSSYDSIESALKKQGKFVHIMASLDKEKPIYFNPAENPNFTSFFAKDSLGNSIKVIYNNPMPGELNSVDKLVLKGKMQGNQFECSQILFKCPSKYKEEEGAMQKQIEPIKNNG